MWPVQDHHMTTWQVRTQSSMHTCFKRRSTGILERLGSVQRVLDGACHKATTRSDDSRHSPQPSTSWVKPTPTPTVAFIFQSSRRSLSFFAVNRFSGAARLSVSNREAHTHSNLRIPPGKKILPFFLNRKAR
jgi:hypothetical protein